VFTFAAEYAVTAAAKLPAVSINHCLLDPTISQPLTQSGSPLATCTHSTYSASVAVPPHCVSCCLLLMSSQHEPEAAVPGEVDPQPFCYRPLPPSSHAYAMVDGVVRIWSDAGSMQAGGMSTELFPLPGSAADFFTDMHRVLRYASLGPVKSFCHHRCETVVDIVCTARRVAGVMMYVLWFRCNSCCLQEPLLLYVCDIVPYIDVKSFCYHRCEALGCALHRMAHCWVPCCVCLTLQLPQRLMALCAGLWPVGLLHPCNNPEPRGVAG
jgi:hypothetical protein